MLVYKNEGLRRACLKRSPLPPEGHCEWREGGSQELVEKEHVDLFGTASVLILK